MTREIRDWEVCCKECGTPFRYSDRSAREAMERGESRPERCADCRRTHNRATARMGAAYPDLAPGRAVPATGLKPGRLGSLQHPDRPHRPDATPPPAHDASRFGLTDARIADFLVDLDRHQVAIVVAPTGSGKSTIFPYRLFQPPVGLPEDLITRHGTIVVTQPRIEASSSIPGFVASHLHGAAAGAGRDIGFQNSKQQRTDHRNRLVYLTDGTLLNRIKRGDLHDLSVIVIDEAHERSLNIDLIIALLRRELRSLPHLKLVIASATIDIDLFRTYFEPDFAVLLAEFPGKPDFPVHDRWRATGPVPDRQLVSRMPDEVARCAHEILRWMARGERPHDIPPGLELDGDILCFVHGKTAITQAISTLEGLLDDDPELARQVEVRPLHAKLPPRQIKDALGPAPATGGSRRRKGRTRARWRVIVSTNLAETSLTVEGIRHVVDSGLINVTSWDPTSATQTIRPTLHSQSGLIQRRGRAGRVAPGMWHCLLTEEQFAALPKDSPPEITRAPLEQVVLAASAGGVSDPASLRWLPPGPSADELRRAMARLRQVGALDTGNDPTALGRELGASREDFAGASLLACADAAGCAVEAAVVLGGINAGGLGALLTWDRNWPAATRVHVDRVHSALLAPTVDDLDAMLTLWASWEQTPPSERSAWADRRFLSVERFRALEAERARLLRPLQLRSKTSEVRPIDRALAERLRRTIAWALPDSVYERQDDGTYTPLVTPRSHSDLVDLLHAGTSVTIDPASRCKVSRPTTIVAVKQSRRRRWMSPLEEPSEHVEVSFCVACEPQTMVDLPALLATRTRRGRGSWWDPDVLPGDRFEVDDDGSDLQVRRVLAPLVVVTASVDDDDVGDEEDAAPFSSTADDEADGTRPADWGEDDRENAPDRFEAAPPARSPITLGRPTDAIGTISTVLVTAVEANGIATCQSEDLAARREALVRAHPVGGEVPLTITSARGFHRDRRVVVTAHHEPTGLELFLDRTSFGLDVRDVLLEQAVGHTIPFVLDAIEVEDGHVELSRVPETIRVLDALTREGPSIVTADVVDAADWAIFVRVRPDDGAQADAPIIVFPIQTRDLPVRPAEMRIGQTVRLQLRPRRGRRTTFWVGDVDPTGLPTGAYELEDDRLVASQPVLSADHHRLVRWSADLPLPTGTRVRAAARAVAIRSHQPQVTVIDVTGIRAAATAAAPTGQIVRAYDDGAVRVAVEGVESTVPARYTSWEQGRDQTFHEGQEVPVYVTEANPDAGRLVISLRDPAANPYRSLPPGGWIDAEVARAEKGFALMAGPAGTRLRLPGAESGVPHGVAISSVLKPGTPHRVRVTHVDPDAEQATCTRFHPPTVIALEAGREALLRTRIPHHAIHAFRDHLTDTTRIDVRGTELELRSVRDDGDRAAIERIVAALSGPLVRFLLPHVGPVTAGGKGLPALRQRFRVCANVVEHGERQALLVAAPSSDAVAALARDLQGRFQVQRVRVGRYRKEVLQAARRDAGLRLAFDGPFGPSGQPGHLTCRAEEVTSMFGILERYGIGVADEGLGVDPRLQLEHVAPPRPATVRHATHQAVADERGRGRSPILGQPADEAERVLPITDDQWAALIARRPPPLRPSSMLEAALGDLAVTVAREPGYLKISGRRNEVDEAIAAIYARLT